MTPAGPTQAATGRTPIAFFVLVLVLSLPFWAAGFLAGRIDALPINLPVSALMAVCPLLAAMILVGRESGWAGVGALLARAADARRAQMGWLVVALLYPLAVALASYALLLALGRDLPPPQISLVAIPLLLALFLAGAVGEELGWSAYATDRMTDGRNALAVAVALGVFWAAWHVVPYIQTGNPPAWIAWQCAFTVGTRVMIVWIYLNAGRSAFAAILTHAMGNMAAFLFPIYGSHYDPMTAGLITAATAAAVVALWGPASLARFRLRPSPP